MKFARTSLLDAQRSASKAEQTHSLEMSFLLTSPVNQGLTIENVQVN
jgi:hypothetical protein